MSVKEKDVALWLSKFFFRSNCFKYHKLDVAKKRSLRYLFRFKRSNEGLVVKNMSIAMI